MMTNPGLNGRKKGIQSFEESIPFIKEIKFTYGEWFVGYETRKITFKGEDLFLDVDYSYVFQNEVKPFTQEFPGMKKDFFEALTALHVGEWEERYDNWNVLDGYSWSLEICFSNGHKAVEKGGSNDYPDNFDDFYQLLKLEENDLMK
ncbi:hypothetical protein [Kallipyga gabonensis]|uniref:hypothetical protein n=1 Tax=Kallipyga gabonensis TaxID=1686287 RepID=UPI0006B658EF|nr:hypothetical protein [Kallipyga gabonensis]